MLNQTSRAQRLRRVTAPQDSAGRFAIAELRQDHISLCDGAGIAISQSGADALSKGHPGTQ
jgi:hypothetical protein